MKLAQTEPVSLISLTRGSDTIGPRVEEVLLVVQPVGGSNFPGTSAIFEFYALHLNKLPEDENVPQQITVPPANLALGAHAPLLTTSFHVNLPSEPTHSTPRHPKVTTQMNATWMKEFKATSTTGSTGSSTSGSRSRAPSTPLSLVCRFNLVFWDNNFDSAFR
jgi:hypothetical protein